MDENAKKSLGEALSGTLVKFAYVFGSTVTGRIHQESDLDIAVYFDETASMDEQFRELLALHHRLAKALGVSEDILDITFLNQAAVVLQYTVISEGVLVYEADHMARVEFEVKVLRKDDDERRFRKVYQKAFLDKLIKEGV